MATEREKNLMQKIFLLANVLVTSNFLMFMAATEPARKTLIVTVCAFSIFFAALVAINLWVYFSVYKKQMRDFRL